jgi:hypothetical protein
MIEQPSLAILIDCWYFPNSFPNTVLFSNILKFIESPFIKTVVLASYDSPIEFLNSNTVWYQNYNKLFGKLVGIDENGTIKRTDPCILNYVSPNKFQIAMNYQQELDHYLKLNPEIKNVYVLGAAWEECVKKRPLGYLQLAKSNIENILTHTGCVLNMNVSNPDLRNDQDWQHVENNIWQYISHDKYHYNGEISCP